MALALCYFLIPALLVFLCQRIGFLEKIGVVVMAFATGIVLAMTVDLSAIFPADIIMPVQKNISEISIAIALPLLLFSINVKAALNMSGDTLKGMGLALLSVMVVCIAGAVLLPP